jgi:hypothetical protein
MTAETLDNIQHTRRHKSPMKGDLANALNSERGACQVDSGRSGSSLYSRGMKPKMSS